jgi:hypothetical protein
MLSARLMLGGVEGFILDRFGGWLCRSLDV